MSFPVSLLTYSVVTAAGTAAESSCHVLSLSGGGAFGAFEAGVLSRMIVDSPGLDYDFMLGVSAGALNAGYLSTFAPSSQGLKDGADMLKTLWASTKSKDVWKPRLDPLSHHEPSLLSNAPLERLLDNLLENRTVQRRVTIGTTDLATGATARHDETELSEATNLLLRASSAIPMIFPPTEVKGSRHVDGGNSANVLTIHGIDRCDMAAKQRGDSPPTIHIDVIMAEPTIQQVPPAETLKWSLLHLAEREFSIAQKQLFDHQLRFHCPEGVKSRISMSIRTPAGVIEKGALALLNFDKGDAIWRFGYNKSNVNTTTFDFCL